MPLKMMLPVPLRRGLPTRAAIEWSAIAQKLSDPRARAALDSLRDVHGQLAAEARAFVREPEAIDFAYYRSVIKNKALVDAMESNYTTIAFPTITPEELDAAAKSTELPDELRLNEQETVDELVRCCDVWSRAAAAAAAVAAVIVVVAGGVVGRRWLCWMCGWGARKMTC